MSIFNIWPNFMAKTFYTFTPNRAIAIIPFGLPKWFVTAFVL